MEKGPGYPRSFGCGPDCAASDAHLSTGLFPKTAALIVFLTDPPPPGIVQLSTVRGTVVNNRRRQVAGARPYTTS